MAKKKSTKKPRTRTSIPSSTRTEGSAVHDEGSFSYRDIKPLAEYIDRVNAEELNFRRFIIKEKKQHYYYEKVLIRIVDGTIKCSHLEYAPTERELAAIEHALLTVRFPTSVKIKDTKRLREMLQPDTVIYEFYDRPTGQVIMVQELSRTKSGDKVYHPWSFWSDGEWRRMEPEADLPFWKPKEARGMHRIMVHEGAKAAAFCDDLVNNPVRKDELFAHPFGEDLKLYEHWGMIGGALAPHRTDYKELKREKPGALIYVCDNDRPGQSALQKVSKYYGNAMKGLRFDGEWPESYDLADPIPKTKFFEGRYVGKRFSEMLVSATYATEAVPQPKGKPVIQLKNDFIEEWFHCVTPEVFVHRDWPDAQKTLNEFNNEVRPFSDAINTALLLQKDSASKGGTLQYDPSSKSGVYSSASGRYINTHVPSPIKPEEGDAQPFIDFLNHLVEVDTDRIELIRWCATLVCRPDIKMNYGCLVISEIQGVGKGTLGEKILAPLVGNGNVSYPSEDEIVDSNYNYWMAHKRLAVVHEIYAGHSSKAYNRMKSVITDRFISVKKKYMANYDIVNWIHVFACSNSMRAIQLSMDDRRWFVPKITEKKKDTAYWIAFNEWLTERGGLQIIKWWLGEWLKTNLPVEQGADAPSSEIKKEIVEEGYSPGQSLVAQTLDQLNEILSGGDQILLNDLTTRGFIRDGKAFVLDTQLQQLITDQLHQGRHNDKLERPATLRKLAKSKGWHVNDNRALIKEWGHARSRMICSDPDLAKVMPTDICNEKMSVDERWRPIDLSVFNKI